MDERMNIVEQIKDAIRIIKDRKSFDVCKCTCHERNDFCKWCAVERLYNAGHRKETKDGD